MDIDWEAIKGIFGFFQVAYKSMVYFANFQHHKTHVSYVYCVASRVCEGWWSDLFHGSHLLGWMPRVLYMHFPYASHTKDDMFYSRWTCHGLWCRHAFPCVCVPHYEYARKWYTPFKWRVSEVGRYPCSGKRMGTIPIVNGNVCGCFRECWHERFDVFYDLLQVH
jgi:hypothetical protein